MTDKNIWNAAKQVCIQTSDNIAGNFDVGFDSKRSQSKRKMCCVHLSVGWSKFFKSI